ncbi:anti-sigma factor domain-containing protein [Aquisalibacillus elongatus]|uniref:Anti-sigma factor-like protein n=1 Tax=Aquisalibacillus elongatus TaxID=485577 RepID=A0A3N5C728_9BACI|nr:anti-sigma factor domain-containing protein [Aquisalibacillus elongatus]RPF54125.1 anti-sigma factor-like protein [Aquisalibacillus elongatus]
MKHLNKEKGIVIKLTDESIVLMLDDGNFKNIPRSGEYPSIGEQYEFTKKKGFSYMNITKYASLASILIVSILVYVLSSGETNEPSYLMVMDINPSIEIEVGEQDKVLGMKGLNEDGRDVLRGLEHDQHITSLVKAIHHKLAELDYINDDEVATISTSIVSIENNIEHHQDVIQQIEAEFEQDQTEVFTNQVDYEVYENAEKLNLTVNQMDFYNQLKKQDKVKHVDEVRGLSIKELNELRDEKKGLQSEQNKPNGQIQNGKSNQTQSGSKKEQNASEQHNERQDTRQQPDQEVGNTKQENKEQPGSKDDKSKATPEQNGDVEETPKDSKETSETTEETTSQENEKRKPDSESQESNDLEDKNTNQPNRDQEVEQEREDQELSEEKDEKSTDGEQEEDSQSRASSRN